ncbi:MAG: hypothetical protein Fur0016_25050 [Anaerolineales bacterium]
MATLNGEADGTTEEAEKRMRQQMKRRNGWDNGGSGETEWTADETEKRSGQRMKRRSGVDNG